MHKKTKGLLRNSYSPGLFLRMVMLFAVVASGLAAGAQTPQTITSRPAYTGDVTAAQFIADVPGGLTRKVSGGTILNTLLADTNSVLATRTWVLQNFASGTGTGGGVAGVSSFNTRTGPVVPLKADYSSFFVDLSGAYANPPWILSLAQSKIAYTGTTAQYVRGDGSVATFPDITKKLDSVVLSGNTLLYYNQAGTPTTIGTLANNNVFKDANSQYWVLTVGTSGQLITTQGTSASGPIANNYLFTGTTSQVTLGDGTYYPISSLGGGGSGLTFPSTVHKYLTGYSNVFGTLNTDSVLEASNLYFTNARAIAAPLTGYVSGAGTVAAADNILQAIQKLNGNIAANTTSISGNTTSIGTLSSLTTTDKSSLVNAINEVKASGGFSGTITATTPTLTLQTSADSRTAVIKRQTTSNQYTVQNTVIKPGGPGNAIQFTSSTNGWMQFANTAMPTGTSATISFSFWFWAGGNGDLFYYNTTTGTSDFRIFTFSNQIWVKGTTGTGVNTTATFTQNTWNNVVVTVNGGTATIYLNGASAASGSIGANNLSVSSGLSEIIDGAGNGTAGTVGNGRFDQFLIYNRVLSSGEVTTIYNSGGGTASYPSSGLIRDYEFEDGAGTTVVDANPSGTTFNGTLNAGFVNWLGTGNGKTPASSTPSIATLISSTDGVASNENGVVTFGDPLGNTQITGATQGATGTFSAKRFSPSKQAAVTAAATTSIDFSLGSAVPVTLAASITTLNLNNAVVGTYYLYLTQDATGSRTVTWPASVKWPAGTAPTLTTSAGKTDVIKLEYDGTNFYGSSQLNY